MDNDPDRLFWPFMEQWIADRASDADATIPDFTPEPLRGGGMVSFSGCGGCCGRSGAWSWRFAPDAPAQVVGPE